MQILPPGMYDAPYGAGTTALIDGLRPTAGATTVAAGGFGSTSNPIAAAAAIPACASDGLVGLAWDFDTLLGSDFPALHVSARDRTSLDGGGVHEMPVVT